MSNGVNTVRRTLTAAFGVIAFFGGLAGSFGALSSPVSAVVGTNEQINFQGRLLNAQGAVVPDGYYNVEFKIYQDGTGQAAGNPGGTLEWTESFLNNNSQGVLVKNGYMSVELGSVNPFGSQVDWNQSVLWLSMNIGNTNATCASFAACGPDGEMTPMKRLSSSVYSMNSANANKLGGLTSAQFIQSSTTVQQANIAIQSISSTNIGMVVQGAASQTADVLQIKAAGVSTPLLAVSSGGQVAIRPTVDTGNAFSIVSNLGNNVMTVDSQNSRIGFGLGGSNQPTLSGAGVEIWGALKLSGGSSTSAVDSYVTPMGSPVPTKISIPHYNPGAFGQVVAMGVPATADSTARVMSLFDARTGAHQPTLSVFNPNESQVFGLSWDGSNTEARLKTTSDLSAIHNNGLNIITARNNGGVANVGIGNTATNGYALDVTGDTNTSTQYRIGGQTALTSSTLTFSAASASSIQAATGQNLNVSGGTATGVNANGNNLVLSGGTPTGTGTSGLVVITTPTFQTATNDANCYTGGSLVATSCTITASSLNNNSAIVVGFSVDGQTATLPNPGISTAGRVVYLTAANGSKDFTISVNGGGVGNLVAMRQNTSATMIWNGTDWTAAGASSSTTLQSAYDNTLQSAGGAELVVSKTSSTNGLTIRESSTAPINGTLLSVQSSSAASMLSVNSNVTEYAANGGAEVTGASSTTFPANTWSALSGTTASRQATPGDYIATGQGSVAAVTTAAANTGVKNQLTGALTASTTYNVSFTTRLLSGTFTDMNVYYSADGSAATTLCSASATARTSIWSKVNCTFTTPASGISASNAIMVRQTGATARTFYVDNLAVNIAANYNFATDPSVNSAAGFSTNWTYTTGTGTGSATRNTADGNDASDSASVTITAGAANAGIRNKLSSNPLPSTLYRATVYAKATTSFTDFKMRYSRDGGTSFVDCVDYNTQTVSTTEWTKVTCYIKTDATAATNPYVHFVETSAANRTFAVDTFSLTLATNSTPNVQIGGGINGGPTTLLTLDKGASAPVAGDNEALLGSMYYDTTLGKLQCFEADGWGACGSSPDTVVTISPEYTNAVLHGTGVGTMVSDLCSDTLNINDGSSGQPTICGTNETYNFYKWTSPQATAQNYSIYVTYQLPSNFSSFASGKTSIMGRTDSTNSTVNYQVYRNDSAGLTACGSPVAVSTGIVSTWQTGAASGLADPSTCGFAPGSSVVFKINVTASQNASAYVGNLNFTFNNK